MPSEGTSIPRNSCSITSCSAADASRPHGGGQCGTSGGDYKALHAIPGIDLCEFHDDGHLQVVNCGHHPPLRLVPDRPPLALDHVANRFAHIVNRDGPGAVAFYLSGHLLTEDYYVANKLMKGFIGSANVDTNSRLCMASAVAGPP